MPGFILYWRDSVTEDDSVLTYKSKRTLLFLYLVSHAEFAGEARGTIVTSLSKLAKAINEPKMKVSRWLEKLTNSGLITKKLVCYDSDTVMIRKRYKTMLVTICNYDLYQGKNKEAIQKRYDSDTEAIRTSSKLQVKTSSCEPLINELNNKLINKEEEGVRKRTTASRKFTRKQLDSIMDTEIIPFGESIGLNEEDIYTELDKWDDWVESKGKRITDNKRAFKNWLRNAVKFSKSSNSDYVSTDNIRRLT